MRRIDASAVFSSSRRGIRAIGAGSLLLAAAAGAHAQPSEAMLQWFELSWENMEYRMPDFFVAGYGGVWLPPPWKASSLAAVGYDCFDRFDLGTPTSQTAYGTEANFVAVVDEFHRAGAEVYIDTIMNHNSGRTSDSTFINNGGWPGFWEENATPGAWGDFHDGTTQSENPGAPNYDLFEGDLVGLIDIAQESNNQFIRHPIDPSDPLNIPAGAVFDQPDEDNRRFYPDMDLTPKIVFEPISGETFTIYPFNTSDPMEGDPVPENATALLMRSCQWMLDVYDVDGFRLDAAKHIPNWFWNEFWDAAVHDRRTAPDGTTDNPFSFVESVESNFFTYNNYVRKDSFANRDALDLNGAGQARNVIDARGFGSWSSILASHIDNEDDGFNNGTVGVNHIYSHDNGSAGDGGSAPPIPADDKVGLHVWSYMLMRTGPVNIYHNAREMHARFPGVGRFWPREGNPTALGLAKDLTSLDDNLTTLVQLRNRYARGEFDVLSNTSDVLVFQRRTPVGGGSFVANVLVACNDRYDSGTQSRTVTTSFPQGLRLHELTGNAGDPTVDPFSTIPEVITVGAGGVITLTVPNNAANGVEHHRGYVVYGPATPSGTLAVTSAQGQTLSPDPGTFPSYRRRLTEVQVVQGPTFTIDLTTTQTDPQDPNTDDQAIFSINGGFEDYNGNGSTDWTSGEFAGFEDFLTVNQPLFTTGVGNYQQVVTTSDLPEGYAYLRAVAFRHRSGVPGEDGGDPLIQDWRRVLYIDREAPQMEIEDPVFDCETGDGTIRIREVGARTATDVFAFIDLPPGDPVPPLDSSSRAFRFDRSEWLFSVQGLTPGQHTITIVAQERPKSGVVVNQSETVIPFDSTNGILVGDVNLDGVVSLEDLYVFESLQTYRCEADVVADFVIDNADRAALRADLRTGEPSDVSANR